MPATGQSWKQDVQRIPVRLTCVWVNSFLYNVGFSSYICMESLTYISVDSWIFMAYIPKLHCLFCCSNCYSVGPTRCSAWPWCCSPRVSHFSREPCCLSPMKLKNVKTNSLYNICEIYMVGKSSFTVVCETIYSYIIFHMKTVNLLLLTPVQRSQHIKK